MQDPTQISEKQQKKVKQFCKEYFDKAVAKHRAHEKKKAANHAKEPGSKPEDTPNAESDEALDVKMSDDEEKPEDRSVLMDTEESGGSLKRKRHEAGNENGSLSASASPSKRPKSSTPTPPPPPPMMMTPGNEQTPNQEGDGLDIKPEHENDELGGARTPPPPPPPPPQDDGDKSAAEAEAEAEDAGNLPKEESDAETKPEIKHGPDT